MAATIRQCCVAYAGALLEILPLALRGWAKDTAKTAAGRRASVFRPGIPMTLSAMATAVSCRTQPPLAVRGGKASMPPPGRFRGKRILVYHEASNDHVEMYVYDERTGVAHNVGVHVLTAEEAEGIRMNNNSWLTADSKEICKEVFNSKANNREFVGITTDHRLHEARSTWNRREDGPSGYGAGTHREVVSEIDIEAYSNGSTIEWVDWELNPPLTGAHVRGTTTPHLRWG